MMYLSLSCYIQCYSVVQQLAVSNVLVLTLGPGLPAKIIDMTIEHRLDSINKTLNIAHNEL